MHSYIWLAAQTLDLGQDSVVKMPLKHHCPPPTILKAVQHGTNLQRNILTSRSRGRIPVEQGVTLYGLPDETGYLKEGEIFVITEKAPEGGKQVLVRDNIAITRSPALHPGDIQLVNAVDVPVNNPNRQLSNVVVFSKWGARDLPSMLSGGDLDGDLYNVIWDPSLIPRVTYTPADYPRVRPVELMRDVTRKDMSDFFVTLYVHCL